jgi:hypothetical protein
MIRKQAQDRSNHSSGASMPAPPAPPSRDANPWPMPEQHPDAGARPQAQANVRLGKSGLRRRPDQAPGATPPRSERRLIPLFIVAGVIGLAFTAALDAAESGDLVGIIVPILIVGVVAFGVLRRYRRKR